LIVTGHLHVAGSVETEGSERRILIGGEHAVPPDTFPQDVQYVALGHLHKAQGVGKPTVRYSGSPLPLSATEIGYDHGLSLVDLHPDSGTVDIEHLSLARAVPFVRVPPRGFIPLPELEASVVGLDLDCACPEDRRPFVHVALTPGTSKAGARAEVDRTLENYPVRSAGFSVERLSAPALVATRPALRLSECDPSELFRLAFEREHGRSPATAHLEAFHEILGEPALQ
jgi:exonuclease SbcD